MSDVIKEFLVALNYKVDGERNVTDSVGRATKAITGMMATLAAASAAIATATSIAARNLEQLYYQSQRVGSSAQNIKAFSFAASQLGTSAEAASDAVESLAQKIKETGGERGGVAGLLRSLGVATSAGGKQRDMADVLVDVGAKLATLAPHVARAYASALGIDEKTLNALMSGKMAGLMRENVAKAKQMGFDINAASKDSVGFMQGLRDLGDTLQMLFLKVLSKAFKDTGSGFKALNDLIVKNAGPISDTLAAVITLVMKLATAFVEWLSDEKVTAGIKELSTGVGGIGESLKGWATSMGDFATRLDKVLNIFREIAKWSDWLGRKVMGDEKRAPNAFGWGNAGRWGEIPDNRTALERILPNGWGGKPTPHGARTGDAASRGSKALPPYSNDLKTAIAQSAKDLGISAEDLATMISFETGGTFDKWKKGPTTKWGEHRGLIQWGEPQRKKYGVTKDSTVGEQMAAVTRYLRDHGVKPGMDGAHVYAAINAGHASRVNASDAAAGGTWGTVNDKWNHQMNGHRQQAQKLMGTSGVMATMAQAARRIGDAIVPIANAAEKAGNVSTPGGSPFGVQPLGQPGTAGTRSVTNTFSPTNNINVYGAGPDMAPILGRTMERTNRDLLRNGVGAFN